MAIKQIEIKVKQTILECDKCGSEMVYTGKYVHFFREYEHQCEGCGALTGKTSMFPTPYYCRVEEDQNV